MGKRAGAQQRGAAGAPQPREPRSLPRALRARAASIESLVDGAGEARRRARARSSSGSRRSSRRARRVRARPRGSTSSAPMAYEAQGRATDAAEARLERAARSRRATSAPTRRALARELDGDPRDRGRGGGSREHEALAELVRGHDSRSSPATRQAARARVRRGARSREQGAGSASGRWRALDARARLARVAGRRRDARGATPSRRSRCSRRRPAKLPRDLREVFWDDPRRRALRQAHTATLPCRRRRTRSRRARTAPRRSSRRTRSRSDARRDGPRVGHDDMGPQWPAEDRLARIFEITRDLAREHDMPIACSRR